MEKLQYLSLVSKVCQELENHFNIKDKVVAEFIIDLALKSPNVNEFQSQLTKNSANFDTNFSENLYKLIQIMKPKPKPKITKPDILQTTSVDSLTKDEQKELFPSLFLPNNFSKVQPFSKIKKEDNDKDNDIRMEYEKIQKKKKSKVLKANGELLINEIYQGFISGVQPYGFFCRLTHDNDGVRVNGKIEGLCHISEVRNEKIQNIGYYCGKGDNVYVKVIQVVGSRISLSLREVDQKTGEDLFERPKRQPGEKDLYSVLKDDEGDGGDDDNDDDEDDMLKRNKNNGRMRRRSKYDKRRPEEKMNEYDLFDMIQLEKAGVIPKHMLPTYDPEYGVLPKEEIEIDYDIELNQDEPLFLKGQTDKGDRIVYEPTKVLKNPEGCMQRTAKESAERARERRELRDQQKNQLKRNEGLLSDPKPKKSSWEMTEDMPEWRRHILSGSYGKITDETMEQQRKSLPIYRFRSDILKAVKENQILVIIGETGSGKTTQIPQFLAEVGYTSRGMIGVTQPRRVAAISVAKRVADEVGGRVGQEVGYTIRFEDCTSKSTQIKYMTDGMLLRESLVDSNLSKYSVIVLDEAHERQLHTDVLFGLCKKLVSQRKDMKLIVTSATLDAKKFSLFFNKCPVFSIPGRTFPVEVMYAKQPETDYLEAALLTVMQIHLTEPPGDILLFLTGQEEIDTSCEILYERMKSLGSDVPELVILPIYSALPGEIQSRIFEKTPEGSRKVVIATNIAETSITIDGIYYVVDPGFVKQNYFNPKTGMESLLVVPISQAQARQRSGRAGRTGPGKCFRLYTEEAFFNELLPVSVPEIQRTNLGNTVLVLKAMGINNLLDFQFMDPPSTTQLINAMESLYNLGALDDEGLLTKLGRRMAEFPLEPQMSKSLIKAEDFGCTDEVLTIVSMLSTQNIFYRPREKQDIADKKKMKFHQIEGDHLTYLAVYKSWQKHNYSNQWCFDNFIQNRSLKKSMEIRKQLLGIMDRMGMRIKSAGRNYTKIRKALTSGYFAQSARKDRVEGYKTLVEDTPVYIHPSSAIFDKNPEYVIYHNLLLTSREYMRDVTQIDPKWLVELAPKFFKKANPKILSKRKRNERIEPLFDRRLKNQDDWRLSKRRKAK